MTRSDRIGAEPATAPGTFEPPAPRPGVVRAVSHALEMQARVLESMREGVSVTDEHGVIIYTNPAEDRLFGYAPGELVGQHVSVQNAYPPAENERIVGEVIARLRADGAWEGDWENVRKDGTPFRTHARITAIEHEGEAFWVCVQDDVTAQRRAQERLRLLHDVTARLAAALTPEEVAEVVVEHGVAALRAHAGSVLLRSDDGAALEVARARGYPNPLTPAARRVELSRNLPLAVAARTGMPVFIESEAAWDARYEPVGPLRALPGSRAWAALPLMIDGQVLGAMGLSFTTEVAFTAEDRAFMVALAQQCAQALERARLYGAERAVRERLRLATAAAGIGTFDWSIPSGRVAWSDEEERLFGLAPGTFGGTIGAWSERVHPEDATRMHAEMSAAMARRDREMDFAFRIHRADGALRWVEGSASFVYAADGTPLRMVGVNVDVTERRDLLERERAARAAAERGADLSRRLLALAAGLSEAATVDAVADVAFEEGSAAIGADAGSLALLRRSADGVMEFEVVRTRGFRAELVEHYRRFPLRAGRPLSDAVLTGTPVLLGSADDWRARYPENADLAGAGYAAFAAVPIVVSGRPLAGLTFSFASPREFDEDTRTFLRTLGQLCAQALERSRAFEAERSQRERTAAVLESVEDGFVAIDAEFRYTYVNARGAELLRRSPGELLGRTPVEVFAGGAASPFLAAAANAMRERRAVRLEEFSATLQRWIEARCSPTPDGGIAIFFQDVTDRRRAQTASEFLAEASRVLASSLDYEVTLQNLARSAVPRLGDWCAVDMIEAPERETWPPVVRRIAAVHQDPSKVALAAELQRKYPTDWDRPSGLPRVLREGVSELYPSVPAELLRASAVDAEHLRLLEAVRFTAAIIVPLIARGRVLGALTLVTSESGRHYEAADLALAEDLARRAAIAVDNARLFRASQEASRAKTQFLATMSHELRTPLNAIAGHVELLAMELHGPVTDAQRDALTRVNRAQRHLLGLINDVLNYARLESGRVEYDVRPVSLARAVADVLPMVEPQMTAKRLTLDVSAGDGDGPAEVLVWADAEKLAQVLLNLLSNAVKFTAEGGRVSVTTAAGRDAPDGTPCAVVRVADTGFGIAPEHLERVFEPFVQVHRQQARESQQGTGLGLAISRDLARGMGGELAAESEVGRGSTFTVTLRRATTEDGRATERRGREERRDDDRRSDEDRRHVTQDQAAGAPPGGGAGAG